MNVKTKQGGGGGGVGGNVPERTEEEVCRGRNRPLSEVPLIVLGGLP